MEWSDLYNEINNIQIDFDKSYKSLTQNRPIQKNTITEHVEILVKCFNEALQTLVVSIKTCTINKL